MNLNALKEPFPAADIEWRVQSCGKKGDNIWALVLAYVTNRAIMNRLDDVCGVANWRNEYAPAPCGGVMCGLSIRIDGEWVTKWDGAENTDIEGVKGGLSGSMKRAAVQWGIGRYLYLLEEGFAKVHDGGAHRGKTKDNVSFRWDPPKLPSFALPGSVVIHADTEQVERIRELLGRKQVNAKQYKSMVAKLAVPMTQTDADAAETWLEALPDLTPAGAGA